MSCGYNGFGQLGHGDTTSRTRFEQINGITGSISENICGIHHTIILLTDGRILSCGFNRYGQLGHGDTVDRTRFEEVKGIPVAVYEVVCGGHCTIIRLINGNIMSCGWNNYGQLGHGDTKDKTMFEEIKYIPKNIAEISCDEGHSMIRLTDGRLMSCGNNCYGQLGHGDTVGRTTFEEIKGWKIEMNTQNNL